MSYEHDIAMLRSAYLQAQRSHDPSSQNVAIVCQGEKVICSGVNGLPHRVQSTPARWARPTKYLYVEHAERNAIYDAALHGDKLVGATMFCPWSACADCARAIIQSGIRRVVRHILPFADNESWNESIAAGDAMLLEAGVELSTYCCPIFDEHSRTPILRGGKIFYP